MAADSKPAEPHPLAMLLPKTFTLPELRQFLSSCDESIDRGNFRRRISELISLVHSPIWKTALKVEVDPQSCIAWTPTDCEDFSIPKKK